MRRQAGQPSYAHGVTRVAMMLLCLLGSGCVTGRQWEFYGANSPGTTSGVPGARPLEMRTVVATDDDGSMYDLSSKTLEIWIRDGEGHELLRDELMYEAADIEAEYTWTQWSEVTVRIRESGDPESHDPYDRALVQQGGRYLVTLVYRYNSENDEFVRVKALPGAQGSSVATQTPAAP